MADFKKLLKDVFIFKEPTPQEEFILKEKESEKIHDGLNEKEKSSEKEKSPEKKKKGLLKNLFSN